jgi:uracil-DNA glycosylase family 4
MDVKKLRCTSCSLATTCRTNKMEGAFSEDPKIIVFLDNPNEEDDCRHKAGQNKYAQLISWLFARMSVSDADFRIEFSIKCHADPKEIKTKAQYEPIIDACRIHTVATLQLYPKAILVGMGSLTCFLFKGKQQVGEYHGVEWNTFKKRKIWITYSPAYAFQKPGELPSIYRVLFKAAEQANLNPTFNPKIQPFDFNL